MPKLKPPADEQAHFEIVPRIEAPPGISKSMGRALGCATFFAGQYLQGRGVGRNEHFLSQTGLEFHAWRKAYVEHLIAENQWSDEAFRDQYVATQALSEDGAALISRDAFTINPDSVYGCELFLSVDQDFQPLEAIRDRTPGQFSDNPQALLGGTLDLLLLEGRIATILDPKSGFSTTGVTDDEPAFYAALVFAHFPTVEEVQFRWDFVRVDKVRRTSYTRDELGWIVERVREVNRQKNEYVTRYNAGQPLEANPFAGLCPYCQLACPLRPRWEEGELAIAMPQKREDAVRLAQLVKVCEDVITRARKLVVTWLDQDPERRLELGGGFEAALRVDERCEYPLVQALNVLGLDLIDLQALPPEMRQTIAENRPDGSPVFDVPLRSLHVSGLTGFFKSRKSKRGVPREGLKDLMRSIAVRGAATLLVIRKPQPMAADENIAELLEASVEKSQ